MQLDGFTGDRWLFLGAAQQAVLKCNLVGGVWLVFNIRKATYKRTVQPMLACFGTGMQ